MSVNNVFVFQDVQHNCQLHRISFCADDKTDKRIFTFICKDSESNKHLCYVFDSEKCVSVSCVFVFSLKQMFETHSAECGFILYFDLLLLTTNAAVKKRCSDTEGIDHDQSVAPLLQAEEITLTIGQAFDLAYKKFLESGGKDVETRKQIGSLQKRVCFSLTQTMKINYLKTN